MNAILNPIDRLKELGGEVFLDGNRVRHGIPRYHGSQSGLNLDFYLEF